MFCSDQDTMHSAVPFKHFYFAIRYILSCLEESRLGLYWYNKLWYDMYCNKIHIKQYEWYDTVQSLTCICYSLFLLECQGSINEECMQNASQNTVCKMAAILSRKRQIIWVRSRNCHCLVTWFCYRLIAKPGNKTATVPWPDPYTIECDEDPCKLRWPVNPISLLHTCTYQHHLLQPVASSLPPSSMYV